MTHYTHSRKKIYLILICLILSVSGTACQEYVFSPIIHGSSDVSPKDPYWNNPEVEASSETYLEVNPGESECTLSAVVIDVGQGSAFLCESAGEYVLIDAGRDATHTQNVIAILKKLGVSEISLVIATHYDYDHIGQMPGVISNFSIKEFWAPDYACDTASHDMLWDYIDKFEVNYQVPRCGDTFSFGACALTVVGPVGGYIYEDENMNSIAVVISDGMNSLFIGGDTTSEGEEKIVNSAADIDVDVYIVNHHGSAGASSKSFLEALEPSYAVISCGVDNEYGHPAERVKKALEAVGATIYRTDQQGDIDFSFCGTGSITFK